MKRLALQIRIIRALRLSPMSIAKLADCLSVQRETARISLGRLCGNGVVRRHGWTRGSRKSSQLFEIVP